MSPSSQPRAARVRRFHSLWRVAFVALSCLASAPSEAGEASGSAPVSPRADVFVKSGNQRTLTGVELFSPLTWNGRIMSFADLRFVADDADGREFNLGLGARRVSEDRDYILGLYGYFDRRRSATGKMHSQATGGAEILWRDMDLRLNGYAPLTGEKTVGSTPLPTTLTLSGNGILARGGETVSREVPLSGMDFEAGYKLGFLEKTPLSETRVYAGTYRFWGRNVETMRGARARIETAPFKWLRLGAQAQDDNARGTSWQAEARLRIPLDFWKDRPSESSRADGILSRLDTRVERDIDVVTGSNTVTTNQEAPVLNISTDAAQKVYVVDNSAAAGGNGTAENPFNTLEAAEDAAGAHDIIYVKYGDGATTGMDSGISLTHQGQKLIGTGVAFTYDARTMRAGALAGDIADGAVIVPAGSAPVVTNQGDEADGIRIFGSDVEVAGLTVEGATGNGIYISPLGSQTLSNVLIRDSVVKDSEYKGILLEADTAVAGVTIRDTLVSGSGDEGIRIYPYGGGSVSNLLVDGATVRGGGYNGIYLYVGTGGLISGTTINNSHVYENVNSGIEVEADGTIRNLTIRDTQAHDNSVGIEVYSRGNIENVLLANVSAYWNSDGIQLGANGVGATLRNVAINDSLVYENDNNGLYIRSGGGSDEFSVKVENTTVRNNYYIGIRVQDYGTSSFTVDLGGGALGSIGQNRLYANYHSDLCSRTTGALKAESNWWTPSGGGAAGAVVVDDTDGGSVDFSPALSATPSTTVGACDEDE